MKRVPVPDGDAVLVSWVSIGAKAAPLLNALDQPSPLFSKISHLYLLRRDAPGAPDPEAVRETTTSLHAALDRFTPAIVDVPWVTQASPTDHGAIRRFVEVQLRTIRLAHPDAHIYLHLSPGTPAMHAVWLVLGATGFVDGPLTMIQSTPREKRDDREPPIEAVPVEVDNWVRRYRATRPAAAGGDDDGRQWEPDAFARGGAMRRAVERLLTWAPLPAPVLLLGERGTGKTSLANVLRAAGPYQRRGKDGKAAREWPSAVCGQFRGDPQIARSELFGHIKGAFTGADKSREGLLTQADGDCLFLDEIADLDRDTQRQLMHAVEGRGFRAVGGSTLLHSRFRLICATNRTPEDLANGVLDPDFLDRVAVLKLTVPPLRACGDDLGVFWSGTLSVIMGQAGIERSRWSRLVSDTRVLSALAGHALPGNIRDLQRVAWHLAVALTTGKAQDQAVEDALQALPTTENARFGLPSIEDLRALLPLSNSLPDHLTAIRGRWMDAAVAEAGGVSARAADLLGVPRETFLSWRRQRNGEREPDTGSNAPVTPKALGPAVGRKPNNG